MLALYIVLGVLVYFVGAGMTYKAIENYHRRACESKFFGAIFWPIALSIWGGILATNIIGTPESRQTKRQDRELAEAQHQTLLAKEALNRTKTVEEENRILDRMGQ